MQQKINTFFKTHPEATEVHEALGVLFIDAEKAESFIGGTSAKVVKHKKSVVETPVVEAPVVEAPVVEAPVAQEVTKEVLKEKVKPIVKKK